MIIFNIYAILIALMVVIFSIPVFLLNYFNVIGDDLSVVLISWIILGCSVIGKQSGVNGRLFFIPMWLLSIPIPFIATFGSYGWTGILITIGVFAVLIGTVLFLSYKSEKRREQEIDYAEIIFPTKEDKPIDYWNKIKDLFFFPSFVKLSPAICQYNLRVIEKIEAENLELKSLADLKNELLNGKNSFEADIKLNPDIKKNFHTEIDEIIAHLQKIEDEKK